ncbi:MAG: ribosomal protein L13e [Candidatus Hodarchaeota archaeon]
MESKQKPVALVKSPAKDAHLREGKGFSLNEIKQAGKTPKLLEDLNISIDYFRKSVYIENIEKLKSIEIPKKKSKKREPFVKKEKKKTPFKPTIEKPKVKRVVKPKAPPTKPVPKPKKKEKIKPVAIEKVKVDIAGTPLTELSGLGVTTAKKFMELGVNNIEELCKEKPEELAPLIKGVSIQRLQDWIEEGKNLTK